MRGHIRSRSSGRRFRPFRVVPLFLSMVLGGMTGAGVALAESNMLVLRFRVPGVSQAHLAPAATAPALDATGWVPLVTQGATWRGTARLAAPVAEAVGWTVRVSGSFTAPDHNVHDLAEADLAPGGSWTAPQGGLRLTREAGMITASGFAAGGAYALDLDLITGSGATATASLASATMAAIGLPRPADARANDSFGMEMEGNAEWVFVGAPYQDSTDLAGVLGTVDNAGAIYAYRQVAGAWTLHQKIVAPVDRSADGLIGINGSFKFDGTSLIVAQRAPPRLFDFRFDGTSWVHEETLPLNVAPGGHISALALGAEDFYITAVVDPGEFGRVLRYRRDADGNWEPHPTQPALMADPIDQVLPENFGAITREYGDVLMIGDEQRQVLTLFERDGDGHWVRFQRLTPPEPSARFAVYLDFDGELLAVGSDGAEKGHPGDPDLANAGAVFLYRRQPDGTFAYVERLVGTNRHEDRYFGYRVRFDGGSLLVNGIFQRFDALGANPISHAGALHVFEREGGAWVERPKIVPPDRAYLDAFGNDLLTIPGYLFVGAIYASTDVGGASMPSGTGKVYVYPW